MPHGNDARKAARRIADALAEVRPADNNDLNAVRAELAQEEAVAKLQGELAAIDAELHRLSDPGLAPKAAARAYERYYRREHEKVSLRLRLLQLPNHIAELRLRYEVARSPGGRLKHRRHCLMIQAGAALGAGSGKKTRLPPLPEVAALTALAEAEGEEAEKEKKLKELESHDREWADLIARTPKPVRLTSRAPEPIPPMRGGFRPARPKPAQIPLDLPPSYPNNLKPQTDVILGEAVRKFPLQTQTLQLCKFVISELTPHFCAAVQNKKMRADLVRSVLSELLHYVLVANCDDSSERFRLEQEAKKSDEWLKLARDIARESGVAEAASNADQPIHQEGKSLAHEPARKPRQSELCYQPARDILNKNPQITTKGFAQQMDRKAEQYPSVRKYAPPARWHVRTFMEQYKKRANTLAKFITDIRKSL